MYFMVLACKRCLSITLLKYEEDTQSASASGGIMLDPYVPLASLCCQHTGCELNERQQHVTAQWTSEEAN